MTVTNRSNDLCWGMLGANYVHFTILQEYLAARLGVVGRQIPPLHQQSPRVRGHAYGVHGRGRRLALGRDGLDQPEAQVIFKIMRLIQPLIVTVPGFGKVWVFYDIKYDRFWARRYEG
jgi:hypothetical protein